MELIKQYFIDNYMYIQFIPLIFGFIAWKKLERNYKWFVLVLLYTFLNEYFKLFYSHFIVLNQNRLFTNIWNAIYFSFLFWLFCKKIHQRNFKNFIIVIISIYSLAIVYEVSFVKLDYFTQTQVIPFIIGGLGILFCVFYYFYTILDSNTIGNIFKDMFFWICIAHFIYYLGFTLFKIEENYFANNSELEYLFDGIKVPITFIKVITLSIGFLWSRQQHH